jgi:hypothetical protein
LPTNDSILSGWSYIFHITIFSIPFESSGFLLLRFGKDGIRFLSIGCGRQKNSFFMSDHSVCQLADTPPVRRGNFVPGFLYCFLLRSADYKVD